jgi:hypothetical protein
VPVTVTDVADRQWWVSEGPPAPTDARYSAPLASTYRRSATDLFELGAGRVAISAAPPAVGVVASDIAFGADRFAAFHQALNLAAAELGPEVVVVDRAGWADAAGVTEDTDWRPDGTHLTEFKAREVIERWLGRVLISHAL